MPVAAIPALLELGGSAVFALTGALLAAQLRQTFVTMAFFALVTGVGGIIRDVLAGRPSILMPPELDVTAAALSAALCAGAALAGLPNALGWPAAMLLGFTMRGVAIRLKLGLPPHGGDTSVTPPHGGDAS